MAIKDVVLYPDAPLTRKAAPYKNVGPDVAKLAAEMFEVMEEFDGCGLAGPQVGIAKRILVFREPENNTDMCLINPEILEAEGREFLEEGCLSLPQVYAMVPRATRLRVRALNQHGTPLEFEAHNMMARIIQHEVDHLDGIVFIDRLDVLTREAKFQEWQEIRNGMLTAAEDE